MKRLLYIELQKLWLNRASKVLVLSYFILLSFIALLASVNFKFLGIDFRLADQGIFNFPYIWHFNTYIADLFKLFLALVIVSMIANEYTYGTLKQNLIDGLSKKEMLQSKLLTVALLSVASTLFLFVMTLILGYSFSSYNETSIVFTDVSYMLYYLLKLFFFFTFCLFAGILIKRSAFAVGFVIMWYVAEFIIFLILRWKIILDAKQTDDVMGFFPMFSNMNLLKEPFSRFQAVKAIETAQAGAVTQKFYGVHWYEIAIALFWTAFFMLMSYRILKKRDL